MDQLPVYSIIISTLNCADKLPHALHSIAAQDYVGSYEVIVIDGGSSDRTLDVVSEYSFLISHFVSEPDLGIYDAWNKGITVSRGEWILFLGSDDKLLENTLSVYNDFLISLPNDVDYISGKVRLTLASGAYQAIGRPWRWHEFSHYMRTAHVGSLHRRHLFDSYGLFSLKYSVCADYEFFMRIGPRLKAAYIDQCLAIMSVGGVSQSSLTPLLQTRDIKIKYGYCSVLRIDLDFIYSVLAWSVSRLKQFFGMGYR